MEACKLMNGLAASNKIEHVQPFNSVVPPLKERYAHIQLK